MKYSFLIPYHDRLAQFQATLVSFRRWYGDRAGNCELIVVVDEKSQEQVEELLSIMISGTNPFQCLVDPARRVGGFNPAPHYNQAAGIAKGEYFILTSPEILHDTNILAGLDEEFEQDPMAYVVCGCQNMDKSGGQDLRMPWYQHSVHRPANYHFCTALSRRAWAEVGGFDEAYSEGVAYDDDDFLMAVNAAGLNIRVRDDLVTHHQWHDKPYKGMPRRRELVQRNKALYESKWKGG